MAACGSNTETPSPTEIADCLRAGGASVELNPRVSHEVGNRNFAPVLTPDTKVVARGDLAADASFLLFASKEDAADHAEDRALEFVRLFGFGREHVRRRGTVLLVIHGSMTARDRDLVRDCL